MVEKLRGKKVLVTGSASGIGRETALALVRKGAIPLLVDINAWGLEDVAGRIEEQGGECRAFCVDITDYEEVVNMSNRILEEFGSVDVLINNAGVFVWGDFIDTELDDWEWIIRTNIMGPVHIIKAFLPGMIKKRGGHIVNVASGGGLVTLPAIGAYCASKFALIGLSEVLSQELRRFKINVTTICPGSTRTPIIKNIRVRGFDREHLETEIFSRTNTYPPEKVASATTRAIERRRPLVVLTVRIKLLHMLKRLSLPLYRLVQRAGTRYFYRVAKT